MHTKQTGSDDSAKNQKQTTVSEQLEMAQPSGVRPKKSQIATIVTMLIVPLIIAIFSAIAGSWTTHALALRNAPEKTKDGAETLLGIAQSALDIAKNTHVSEELLQKLQVIASQARAVEANISLLRESPTGVSIRPDFWLPRNSGAILGGNTAFGIHNLSPSRNEISVLLSGKSYRMRSGTELIYTNEASSQCKLIYLAPSPDNLLHGFRVICDT
ncbi:hypothetical protein QE250_10915 [Chromatiaceae bacterium AAb-1]|nr:hypothetical protein [Chromatiaceae bacterium AAb-1]